MSNLINFCINSSEEEFFKYVALSASIFRDSKKIDERLKDLNKMLDKYAQSN